MIGQRRFGEPLIGEADARTLGIGLGDALTLLIRQINHPLQTQGIELDEGGLPSPSRLSAVISSSVIMPPVIQIHVLIFNIPKTGKNANLML